MSRRELERTIDRYPWFTPARRARALATGGDDEALVLPLLFWPTVAPTVAPTAVPVSVSVPVTVSVPVPVPAPAPVEEGAVDCAAEPVDARSVLADDLIDRFINHGGYRITPDGEAADVRVDVEIAPEMVTPQLAAIYRSQGLTAEAENIEKILNGK